MSYEYDSWIVLVAQSVNLLIWIWFVLPSLSVYVQVNTLVLNTTDYHSVLDHLNIRPFLWWTMLIYTWDWDATVCCFSIPRLPESNLPLMWFSLLPSSRKTWKKLFIVFAHTHSGDQFCCPVTSIIQMMISINCYNRAIIWRFNCPNNGSVKLTSYHTDLGKMFCCELLNLSPQFVFTCWSFEKN